MGAKITNNKRAKKVSKVIAVRSLMVNVLKKYEFVKKEEAKSKCL
jgi:hypothetical protein